MSPTKKERNLNVKSVVNEKRLSESLISSREIAKCTEDSMIKFNPKYYCQAIAYCHCYICSRSICINFYLFYNVIKNTHFFSL